MEGNANLVAARLLIGRPYFMFQQDNVPVYADGIKHRRHDTYYSLLRLIMPCFLIVSSLKTRKFSRKIRTAFAAHDSKLQRFWQSLGSPKDFVQKFLWQNYWQLSTDFSKPFNSIDRGNMEQKKKKKEVRLTTLVEGDPKPPFSIAITPRCWGGHYSIPWIAPLYPWYLPYNAEF